MPTYKELLLLAEETPVQTAKIGTFTNITASMLESTHKYGKFNPQSGWFAGTSVNASTPSTANMQSPPEHVVFLPASGQRYPNGDGSSVHVGAYGYYWSGTPYTTYSVNYFFMSKYGMDSNDADRSYAFPVRCIRDN